MSEPRRSRRSRLWVVLASVALVGLCTFALMLLAGWVYLRSEAGNERLRAQVESFLQQAAPGGEVTLGGVRTDLYRYLEIRELHIADAEGESVVYVERAVADVALGAITRLIVRLPQLRIDGLLLDLESRPDGILNLAHIFGQVEPGDPDAPWEGLPIYLDLPEVDIRGLHLRYSGASGEIVRLVGVDAVAAVQGREQIDIDELSLRGLLASPGPAPLVAQGGLTYTGAGVVMRGLTVTLPRSEIWVEGGIEADWSLALDVRRLHLPDIDPIAGGAGLGGTLTGAMTLAGPGDRPRLAGALRGVSGTFGRIDLDLALGLSDDPLTIRGDLELSQVYVEHLYPDLGGTVVVNGRGQLDLELGAWPDDLILDLDFTGGRQEAFGQELDALVGRFRIEGGVLHLSETVATGIVGELQVGGQVDLVQGPMSLRIQGTVEPARLQALGVEGLQTTGRVDARVRGDVLNLEDPIRADGTVRWAPFRYDGSQIDLSELVVDLNARITPARITGTGQARLGAGAAYGVHLDQAQVSDLQLDVPLDPPGTVTLRGLVDVAEARMPDLFRSERTVGDFALQVPQAGAPEVRVGLELQAHEVLDFPGTSGQVQAVVAGDDVQFQVQLQYEARDTVVTEGGFQLDTQRLELSTLVLAPTPRATWVAERPVRLCLTDTGIADADVALSGNLGALELTGTVGTAGLIDAELSAVDFQLDTFAELFPDLASGLSGVANVQLQLGGTGEDPSLEAELTIDGLWVEDVVRWLDIEGTVSGGGGVLRPALRLGLAGEPLGVLEGIVPVSLDLSGPEIVADGPLDLELSLLPGALERLEFAFPSIERGTLPVGEVSAHLRASGTPRDPVLRAAGIAEVGVDGWTEPGRMEFDVRRDGEELFFWSDLRQGLTARATLSALGTTRADEILAWVFDDAPEPDFEDLELWLEEMRVDVVMLGMPARSLAEAAGVDLVVSGDLVGGVSVTGSPYQPVAEGGFHWVDGQIGEVVLDGALLSLIPDERGYLVDLQLDFEGDSAAQVVGSVPVRVDLREEMAEWTAGELDLRIGGELPLEALSAVDPGIRNTVGALILDGSIGGTLADPVPRLSATLTEGSLIYDPLALRISEVEVELSADQRRVALTRFRARTEPLRRAAVSAGMLDLGQQAPSIIRAVGNARLEDGVPSAVSAQVRLENGAWVSATQEAQLRVDGELRISGAWPALDVSGRMDLRRGVMNFDAATFLGAASLEPDPRLRIVRTGVVQLDRPEPEPPIYQDFNVNVVLSLGRNLTLDMGLPLVEDLGEVGAAVTRADVNARLGSQDLQLTLTQGEPTLLGEVEVIDGRVRVLSSRMDLQTSRIVFSGGPIDDPALDLHAQMSLPEGSVNLYVRGSVQAPDPEFTSEEYPDQSQILAILLTGRAPEDMSQEEAEGTAQALAGLLLDSLFAGQALGGLSIGADGSVEVGIPVGSTLYTTTRIAPTAGITENRIAFGVEWTIAPRLVLGATVGELRQWADLYWEVRF